MRWEAAPGVSFHCEPTELWRTPNSCYQGELNLLQARPKPYHVETSTVNMSKSKVVPVHTIKIFGSRVIAPFIPNLKTIWSRVVSRAPAAFTPWKRAYGTLEIGPKAALGYLEKEKPFPCRDRTTIPRSSSLPQYKVSSWY